jgi:peptidoglycan/xylan/chitin deacetylase (PgdA/CDA1 family)
MSPLNGVNEKELVGATAKRNFRMIESRFLRLFASNRGGRSTLKKAVLSCSGTTRGRDTMEKTRSFWDKIERRVARYRACRTMNLIQDRGIVCFTFDDAQRSACVNGAAILEKHGLKGTFYISGGLTETSKYHTPADLLQLVGSGHELGSHGYGHHSYQSLSKDEIVVDLRNNLSFFEKLGCHPPRNFAYPYGHVSTSAKRIVSREFVSSRGIQPGINFPTADLALLKAFPLYHHLWTENRLALTLEENAKICGLSVFVVHGVLSDPGKFDCSIQLLESAVRISLSSGNRVMSVQEALPKVVSIGTGPSRRVGGSQKSIQL